MSSYWHDLEGDYHEAIRHDGSGVDGGDRAGSAYSRSWKHGSVGQRPRYVTSTMTFDNVFPAGTICDFDFHNMLTVSDSAAIFPDRMIDHFVTQTTGTNLALVSR